MCIMIITFKIDSAVQNPKDKILQILEEFISQANQDVDFQNETVEEMHHQMWLAECEDDQEESEAISYELEEEKSKLESLEEELNKLIIAKEWLDNAMFKIDYYTHSEPYQAGLGLYEVDLFGEERSVCYMAKLIFEGFGEIDGTIVKLIKSRLAVAS